MTIPNMNLSEAKREDIEPGGYIVEILGTFIDTKYNRLQLQVDICVGPHSGYFTKLKERANFWGLTANLSLDEKDAWKFKNAVDAMRVSDVEFIWHDDDENDEKEMVGVEVGAILQRKRYVGNDGQKKTKLLVNRFVPVGTIERGEFTVPDDLYADDYPKEGQSVGKVVDTTAYENVEGFKPVDDDVPF